MKRKGIIRSSTTSLKFANAAKKRQLKQFIADFRSAVEQLINLFWEMDKVPAMPQVSILNRISSPLSVRVLQNAGKQASGIVRGTRAKQTKRLFIIKKLQSEGKNCSKVQRAFDKAKVSKPELKSLQPQLSARTFDLDLDNQTSFDGWLTLVALGGTRGAKIQLPFKRTEHFNKLMLQGKMLQSVRISEQAVSFCFEQEQPEPVAEGITVGLDIGETDLFVSSNGQFAQPDQHGWTLKSIADKMCRKKKGSKGFMRAQAHRNDFINWSLKQLNLTGIKQLNIESIRHLRRSKRTSRRLSHWCYPALFEKIGRLCEEAGVLISHRNPMFTSQRCSTCGWTQKSNRTGKMFKCKLCGFAADADLNASQNLSIDLPLKTWEDWRSKANRRGFFWNPFGQEPMVPVVQESQGQKECS